MPVTVKQIFTNSSPSVAPIYVYKRIVQLLKRIFHLNNSQYEKRVEKEARKKYYIKQILIDTFKLVTFL